jgi:hypothetical protein
VRTGIWDSAGYGAESDEIGGESMTERDELIDTLKAKSRNLGKQREECISRISDLKVRERELSQEQGEVVARMNELMSERADERQEVKR